MTKPRRWARRALLGLAVAAVGLGAWSLVRDRTDPSSLPKEIRVDIGAGYTIPRELLASVPVGSDGEPEHALIRVLWPSMEPLTQANRHLWAPELPGRQILNILVQRFGADGAAMLQAAIGWGTVGAEPEPGPHGLMLYQRDNPRTKRTERRFVPQEENYRTPTGSPLVLDCSDMFNWESQRTLKLLPICKVDYLLDDKAFLYYHFYVANLQYWRQIDAAVRNLVRSFRKP